MALAIYNDEFFDAMDRMMENNLSRFLNYSSPYYKDWNSSLWNSWSFPTDLVEHEDHYELVCDCPGYSPQEISIEEKGNYLTISGERKSNNDSGEKKGKYYRKERSYSKFTRSFTIPENVKSNEIGATLQNGVLKISLPKSEPKPEQNLRKIPIQSLNK